MSGTNNALCQLDPDYGLEWGIDLYDLGTYRGSDFGTNFKSSPRCDTNNKRMMSYLERVSAGSAYPRCLFSASARPLIV